MDTDKKTLIAKTVFGLEELLAKEIEDIGGEEVSVLNRAVSFIGDLEMLYKANIQLRTAIRILYPIRSFTFSNQEDYYRKVKKMKWDDFMNYSDELAVDSVVNSTIFTHSKFLSQRTKDAIVDFFRDNYGQRPSVNLLHPDLRIHVHINENRCDLSLDSSGDPLFMRRYRSGRHAAPLNEVLAAGMVLMSGWDKKSPLIDPMCGSGTIGIEAAMIAHDIPPTILREDFGFKQWYNFDEKLYRRLKKHKVELKENGPQIICSDISPIFSRMAKASFKKLDLAAAAKCFTKDFEKLAALPDKGMIIMNPPYGERLEEDDILSFYGNIGSRFKHEWMGYDAWLLTSNLEAVKSIGLKHKKKHILYNGALECRFLNYSLYAGSKKEKKEGL